MPRPRFAKLPPPRRRALLEAAAQEFGALGFEDASINHILERAGVSKGAAYYYFDDKEDLFLTVVQHYMAELGVDNAFDDLPERVTADTFWPTLTEIYSQSFVRSRDYPWGFGVWRAAGELWRAKPAGALAAFVSAYLEVLRRLLERGQELGVIRTDLPDDLLMAWARAVDDANDRWILDHWDELDVEALEAAANRVVDGLRRLIGAHGC